MPSSDVVRTFKKIQEESPNAEKIAEKSDNEIGLLAYDPRWLKFKEVIEEMIVRLEQVENIEATDSVEAIGFKFLVSRATVGQLKAIRDLPEAIARGEDNGGTEQNS